MIASVSGSVLGWMVLAQMWLLVFWYIRGKNPFARRLDQLLALLLAETEAVERPPAPPEGERRFTRLMGSSRLGRVKWSARRWRKQLRPIYAQGYQAAAETISPSGHVERGRELVQDTLVALKAKRRHGGTKVPAREDPVVVFAYGLGAWPTGADLTSLERLLADLGVSQPAPPQQVRQPVSSGCDPAPHPRVSRAGGSVIRPGGSSANPRSSSRFQRDGASARIPRNAENASEMTKDPWHRKTTRNRKVTLALRGVALALLLLYVSMLVGARFT